MATITTMCHSTATLALLVALGASAEANVRGVPPNRMILYDTSRDFTCFNGAQTISFDQVNDNYCDCADGSDEPGTSACSNSVFFCANKGAKKMEIPSYRVNDGVCDCCDATDEYETGKCSDICEEAGRAMREAAALERKMQEEGAAIKAQLIEKGQVMRKERDIQIAELAPKKQDLENKKQHLEEEKNAAETPEKEAKDSFDKQWDETVNARRAEAKTTLFKFIDIDASETIELGEVQSRVEFDADENGETSQEEAEEVFDQDGDGSLNETEAVMNYERFENDVYETIKEKFKDAVPLPDEAKPGYDESIQLFINAADAARTALRETEDSLRNVNREYDDLVKKNDQDYGPDGAWAALDGECYSADVSEYKYTLCPFGNAKQEPKNGGSSTSLGNFKGFVGPEGNKYSKMAFEGGQKCWNGPSRSLTVEIKCGSSGVISNVLEPSKCEYTGILRVPVACVPPGPEQHDEL